MNQPRDKGLNGNEKIEQAVAALQQEPTQEQLAHTLTVIRRRIKEHGQLVVAVEPNLGSEQMQLRAIRTAEGTKALEPGTERRWVHLRWVPGGQMQ